MAFIPSEKKVPLVSGNDFEPIPAGKYRAYLFDADERTFGPNSNNADRPYYNIQLKIADGEYENRRVFMMVGLFPVWAPTAKNPDGADNFTYFDFYAAVNGMSSIEARKLNNEQGGLDYPDPEDFIGMVVEADIGIRNNTYQGETTKQNTVRSLRAVKDTKTNNITPTVLEDTVVEIDL